MGFDAACDRASRCSTVSPSKRENRGAVFAPRPHDAAELLSIHTRFKDTNGPTDAESMVRRCWRWDSTRRCDRASNDASSHRADASGAVGRSGRQPTRAFARPSVKRPRLPVPPRQHQPVDEREAGHKSKNATNTRGLPCRRARIPKAVGSRLTGLSRLQPIYCGRSAVANRPSCSSPALKGALGQEPRP